MMYHGSRKWEFEQKGGVRRVEFRYSGDIDDTGRFRLKRCAGKSFLDKSGQAGAAQDAGISSAYRLSHVCPDKTA